VFAPHLGHPHSEDLDSEYLNILETRTRTPFFQDVYVDGVRVMLIIGPTGTGKSVHGNQLISLEQKYGGFTYIFDIGGSYESVVELYGGKVDRVGKDGPNVNPFALEPTESNIKFLYSFVKLLLTNGGAELEPEDDDVIHKAVQDMYLLDPANRRLSNLFLPKKLDRYLSKWIGKGVYHAIFDNVDDSLSLSRLQCFDFQGVNNEQYADLIEPLMVWLLRRINDVLYEPANLGVPKHILIEEIFSSMKNRQLLEGALASIKTVRKNLGGVTMIGQSVDDLGENADSIVNSCTSFLFLKDATFNRKRCAELFKMNEQQSTRRGWIFITSRPTMREALRPLISLWIDTLVLRLLNEPMPDQKPVWFVIIQLRRVHPGILQLLEGSACFDSLVLPDVANEEHATIRAKPG
jgi:type IV secretion system protein VirB4